MRNASWLPLAIMALLALITFWLGKVADSQLPGNHGGFAHETDYVVENFSATTFNAQGQPRYRLSAKTMLHYMDDDSSELDSPLFERQDGVSPPISVHSRRGLITSEGEDVYFLGNVRMLRAGSAGQEPLELTTEYMRVIPDDEIMRTDKPVVLHQGTSVITAAGLFADGDKRILELAGRVKAIYEKQNK